MTEKTILVTGASGGIGAAVARRFLAGGWRVGLMARRAAELQAVADGNPNAVVLVGDVTDEASVAECFARFCGLDGRLDMLFNNAGIFLPAAPIDEIPVAEWRRAVDVNLTGMFLSAREAFGRMKRQTPRGGRIVNNGSISAHVPRPGAAAYTATKHAVTGLTRQISLDGRDLGIACGQIDIGNAATPMLEELAAKSPDPVHMFDVAEVAEAVWQMSVLPLTTNVQFMTIMATRMPYIGRG
jgi:NAD(P)-dependent dehydrogenase (short-subunit alcohol dehydrogenase family)